MRAKKTEVNHTRTELLIASLEIKHTKLLCRFSRPGNANTGERSRRANTPRDPRLVSLRRQDRPVSGTSYHKHPKYQRNTLAGRPPAQTKSCNSVKNVYNMPRPEDSSPPAMIRTDAAPYAALIYYPDSVKTDRIRESVVYDNKRNDDAVFRVVSAQ